VLEGLPQKDVEFLTNTLYGARRGDCSRKDAVGHYQTYPLKCLRASSIKAGSRPARNAQGPGAGGAVFQELGASRGR